MIEVALTLCGAEALLVRTKERSMERSIGMQSHFDRLPPEHPRLEALPLQDATSPDAERKHTRLYVSCLPLLGRQL